jgi:3-phenylpropionate/trans-cinnamate dioxygenase ferredoxin subunit
MTDSANKRVRLSGRALSDGQMTAVDVDGEAILLCRIEGRYYALRDVCSHADQALSEGRLRGNVIYCPLHGARFDVRTGDCLARPATENVQSYCVEEEDGALFLSRARERPAR